MTLISVLFSNMGNIAWKQNEEATVRSPARTWKWQAECYLSCKL